MTKQSANDALAPVLARAAQALAARDWPALQQEALRLQSLPPAQPAGYRYEAQALAAMGELDAADGILRRALLAFPRHLDLARDFAVLGERRGDTWIALKRWRDARGRLGAHPAIDAGLARALLHANLPDAAERHLAAATRSFPDDADLARLWAKAAVQVRNWHLAAFRAAALRRKFPTEPDFFAIGSLALRHLGDALGAEQLAADGLAQWPAHDGLLAAHAHCAASRQDWRLAEQRWRKALSLQPRHAEAYAGLAHSQSAQGQVQESEATLLRAMQRLPDVASLSEDFAFSAMVAKDWREAVARWRAHLQHFPRSALAYHRLGKALLRNGESAEAEGIFAEGIREAPAYLDTEVDHAWLAQGRGDFAEAARRWEAAQKHFPDRLEPAEGLMHLRLDQMAPSGAAADIDTSQLWQEQPAQAVLSHFESLGEHCEFGLVQRQFGLEPISLLRWVAISLAGVIDGLEEGFTDLGNPAHTSLKLWGPGGEYFVRDRKYRFGMHTFVKDGAVEKDKFYVQQCRRLKLLGRKFMEDLQTGDRCFVHFRHEPAPAKTILQLAAAVRRHGPAYVLYVQQADATHAPGTVRLAAEGLILGYIERFGKVPPIGWKIAYESWLDICRNALDLRSRADMLATAQRATLSSTDRPNPAGRA